MISMWTYNGNLVYQVNVSSVGVARLREAQIFFELLCSAGAEIDTWALNG